MQKTDNYELNLPEAEDFFNVEDFNDNTKKIDEVLESLENPEHDTGKQAEVEELASGESLKVALRKLAKAVKDLISHLADKVVHITSNERTLWNTVSNKAESNHTHKYAGSSSAGGAATTAFSSDTVKTVQLANDADLDTLTNTSFTLYYASHGNAINNNPEAPYGFSLCVHRISGGDIVQELVSQTGNKYIRSYNNSKWKAFKRIACTTDNVASADKLNTDAGSTTQPVYFKDGIPVATTYTLGKSVPSDAVFTDTKYTHPTTAGNKHIPAGGSSGQMLKWSADGTAAWTSEINATKATQDGNGNNIVNTYASKSIYDDSSINLGRRANTTVGTESVALGSDVTASGKYSHAEGFATTASGTYSHAEGYFAKASGTCSHAECNGEASGNYSHAEGVDTTASGNSSHAEGYYTTASGTSSHAEGTHTTALDDQHAQGHYNDTTLAVANSESGTSDGTAFVIGNGTSTAKSNAFRITGKGVTYAKGAYNSTGADYAEFAEWADGNPNNEDRRGYFVTFDEEKTTMIRKANAGDYVLGIVSGNPCIIGNADEGWLGKYVFDEFGSIVYEDVEVEETYTDETGEEKTRTVKVNTYKINPEYDPTREYIHREKRKEWAAIGWIGVLSVRDDNTCKAGGYCNVTDGGIATAAERGIDTYRVLERVTDNIVKVAIK